MREANFNHITFYLIDKRYVNEIIKDVFKYIAMVIVGLKNVLCTCNLTMYRADKLYCTLCNYKCENPFKMYSRDQNRCSFRSQGLEF